MKIGLLGFGKAGKAVASVLLQSSEVSLQWVLRKSHTLRLKHESITREAFGNGVLFAASHIGAKEPGLYNMEDLLLPYFNVESSCAGV